MVTFRGSMAEFRFLRPGARQVHLVGDFNGWALGPTPMKPADGAFWVCRVSLPRGTYRFRYVADGQWFTDFAAFGVEPSPLGMNSVLRVGPRGLEAEAAGGEGKVASPRSRRPARTARNRRPQENQAQDQPSEAAYV